MNRRSEFDFEVDCRGRRTQNGIVFKNNRVEYYFWKREEL